MSYLGIDNTYKDGVISAGAYTTDPHLIAKLDFATEALRRWAAKYPNDPELARSYYLAVQVLRKVYTQSEQQVTWEFMHLLAVKYGNTYFGKTEKAVIAQVTRNTGSRWHNSAPRRFRSASCRRPRRTLRRRLRRRPVIPPLN